MEYGAGHKGALWKIASFLAGFACAVGLFLFAIGEPGGGVAVFIVYGLLAVGLSLPYGLRRVDRTGVSAGVFAFPFLVIVPWFLALFVWFWLILIRSTVWFGDLALTSVWRLVPDRSGAPKPYRHTDTLS